MKSFLSLVKENIFRLNTWDCGCWFRKNPEILGEFINNSNIKQSFKNKDFNEHLFKDGVSLIYSKAYSNSGLISTLVKNEKQTIIASLHPFFNEIGLNYRGEISEVNVWEAE